MADFDELLPPGESLVEGFGPLMPEMEEIMPPEEEETFDELGSYIESLYNKFSSSEARQNAIDTVADSRKKYEQESDSTNFPWPEASNMVTPITRIAVDELEPRLVAAVVGREPYIRVKPHAGSSTPDEAHQVEEYDNFVLKEKLKIVTFVADAIHELLLDGTVYPLLSWVIEEKTYAQQTPMGPQEAQGVSYEGPRLSLVSVEHVWLPDDVDDDDWESKPVIRYVDEMTLEELKRRSQQENGWVLANVEKLTPSDEEPEWTEQQKADAVQNYEMELPPELRTIKRYEAYLNWNIGGEASEPIIVEVEREGFTVLRVRRQVEVFGCNVKPLRRLRLFPKRGVSWGQPVYKNVKGIQEGLDAMWNRCINSADIAITPWGFIQRGMAGSLRNRMRVSPGQLFEVDNPEAFVFPNLTQFNPQSFIPLILQYVNFFQRLTVSDFMQGMEDAAAGKKGTTATGTMAILQEGKIKHEYRGTRTHSQFLEIFILVHNLLVDNMPMQEIVAITGQPINKFTMAKDYIFELGGSSATANRFIDRKEMEDFQMVMQPYMSLINPMQLLKDMLHSYDKKPIEEYIDPELNQIVQQYLQMKQNTQQLEQMGLRPEIAKQASQMGFTPDTVKEFIKQGTRVGFPQPPEAPQEGAEGGSAG